MIKKLLSVAVVLVVLVGCQQPSSDELVENGVQSVTLCGKKGSFNRSPIMDDIAEVIPNANIGTWHMDEQGDCNVWYHESESGTD